MSDIRKTVAEQIGQLVLNNLEQAATIEQLQARIAALQNTAPPAQPLDPARASD